MDILQKFKQNGYFTAELYHLLAKKKFVDSAEEIIPSDYQREMGMDTHERLQNLNTVYVDNIVTTGQKDKSIVLSFTPRLIVFQNFKPNEKIITKFSVKNISTAPTYLNMVFKESSYFFIKPCGGQLLSRLAPGISVTFAITFIPMQHEDYIHRVIFNTDTDQYILPLIAMGPRPIFDFPDQIPISSIPLKIQNEVFVTVHNIGMVSAGFSLIAKCPFSVQPKSAYLDSKEKIDIKITFKTMKLGETRGTLRAVLETGEIFTIGLIGTTHTISVEFEKEIIRFLDTYNTMVRQQTYKIINRSNNLLTYMCMKNDGVYNDFEEKVKLATMFYNFKESESAKCVKLVKYDVLSSEEHERVYTRIFCDEIQALVADETLYFQNMHFSITPIKGNLWPNKATEITITFSPKEIGEFTATAYLDVDGVLDRVPLKLMGTSLPPSISLNLETLDMDCVYINKTYHYEIVAINKGHINGVIVYKEVAPLFGSIITCSPELHCLRPGDKEIFIISFCNSNQGPYFEEINFVIRHTDVVLKLYLKGEVIYPSLMFSVPCLDFGNVSLGVPKTLELDVINESVVNVNGSVKISSDGPEISSITLTDYAVAEIPKPEVPQWPREFNIEPCKINIKPESKISLKVTLTANLVRANHTSLELELENSDSPPIIVPVMFNAMVPEIKPAPDIKLRECFIDFSYDDEIIVTSNEHWGYFTLEEPKVESTLHVNVGVKEGFIEPNSTITLPVSIKTNVLGVQEFYVRLNLFGLSKPIDICYITGCGVRPIVTCFPITLHWGHVKLLSRTQKTLTLYNDSPVNVYFEASLFSKDGRWQIEPTKGYIEPESETELVVSLYSIDAASYTNKAVIQLEKVKDILVPLTATGVGTSIVVGELRDKIDLGRHFTKIPLNCKVTIENFGTRLHALEWSEHYKAPKSKQQIAGFFNLDPRVFKLAAGEKIELSIAGSSSKVTVVKEMWYLVGSVEGINKKELLLECQITAEFVDPKIEVSSSVLELQYDYGPYSEFYKLTDIITIKNVSKLPLDIEINIKPPFAIIQKQDTYKILPEEENLCCCIRYHETDFLGCCTCYNKTDLNISSITNELGLRQSRLFVDFLTLKPVEPNRKGPLHFFEDINKIKMAFNRTHSVEQLLEDQEVMKIQILFDTTKHLSLKSRVYCDLMRIKFKGHRNKDAIKLIGKVNFPNILVLSPRVDFQCVLNDSLESKTIKIQNITPLLVCYRLQWKKCIIIDSAVPELPKIERSSEVKSFNENTEPRVSKLHGILPCQSLAGSNIEKLTECEHFHKEIASPDGNNVCNITSLDNFDCDHEFMNVRIIKTITPMLDGEYDSEFDWASKFPKKTKSDKINVNDIFSLTPHRGLLKPNEIQYIQVIFKPPKNTNVRALLECEVLGGPSESIMITGQSSDLMYKINTQKINFKIKSFHQQATEQLLISNEAQLPFEIRTYLCEPKLEKELEANILNVIPTEKVLAPQEEIEMKIVMRPGVMGYFKRVFLLEIGHLPHIPIEVFGWGVIPQVYISLPRSKTTKICLEAGYLAIPSLTIEYLEAISEYFIKPFSEHLNSPLIENCFDDPDFLNDWHICSTWDGYPSAMDIELAIERMLVTNHIKLRPEILTTYATDSKMGPIPGFHKTPYVIDYGVVITGSTVHCITEIINYGPIVTKLRLAKRTQVPGWLGIKLCGKLNPGETGKLEVVFSPNPNDFVELEENVETSFNLEVPYGVTIPIQIKALCAVPYLATNVKEICFGSVRCGDKIISNIPLRNVGKPTCIWYVALRLKVPGPNPISVMDNSGKYEPGEGGWLSIAFKPNLEMVYEGLLIFRFHMNPNRLVIPISGQGILPQVHIIGPNVNFPPTLPWSETTDMYFGLTNPCPFPIELIIAHSDDKWKEEEEVYQLLYKYYNKPEEMLVPAIKPGDRLPPEVLHFYKNFTDRVRKTVDEESATARAATGKSSASVKKMTKGSKNASKSLTPKEATPRKFRTEAEIIADEFKTMKENNVDPLKQCLQVFEHVSSDPGIEKHNKGLIIFVHGSPCEDIQCKEMAYTLGKNLNIPTLNIDNCIVDALCVCECSAKFTIISVIKEIYETSRKYAKGDSLDNEGDSEEIFIECEKDDYDVIWKKIEFLASNKNVGTPRSKVSDKKKKKSPNSSIASHSALGALGSTTMFQMELIQELLSDYFIQPKFNKGFIIDSLTSIIIKSPPLVLTTVLKCKRSIRNIHLVLCQSDFYKWAQSYEETQRENDFIEENISKVYNESEIENIIQSFEDMTEEEYATASPELKSLYVSYGLEERRRKYYDKTGLPNDSAKKEKSGKDHSKSLLTMTASESKKKLKKDDTKGKPTTEYLAMNTKYNEYNKNTYEHLINIANNWILDECDLGSPLYGFNGQVVGTAQKKVKKKSDVQLQVSEVNLSERGFPLTLIMCPCLQYKKALVNMFLTSPLVQEALKEEEEFDILKYPMNKKEFTVLIPKTFPNIHYEDSLKWCFLDELPIKKCECNQLTDLHLLDDSTQDNVLNILSKWHCTCAKKKASSQTSTSEIPSASVENVASEDDRVHTFYPLPLSHLNSVPATTGRLVLQPGDLVRCKYSFAPQVEGNFSLKRFIEVSGWPDSRVDINVNGICDLPRLDSRPKKMFKNFVRRTAEDKIYKISYLDDLKLFEFGPIFIGNNRVYEEEYTIDLKNSSLITADIDIEFQEETQVFRIDKAFIRLEPGCRDKLTISAAPTEVGVHNSILLLCVKDNPEITILNIGCIGVVPIVEILPLTKMIEYGKLLLYRREDDRFIVKNDSILPILWKIRNNQEFIEDFIIAQTSGIIPRHDNQVVPVTYIACKVGVVSQKTLIIDIYDADGRGEPMVVDNLYLSAECYDVKVECAYENPAETFLNYGNVKVNSTVVREMYLLNRGRYNIYYKLKKVKNFPEPSLLKSFELTPECGIIPATVKLTTIEFECTPTTSMNLVNVPAFICSLLDGSKDQVVVAKFPICVTIASFYNTFTLFPLGELNFHIIPVGSGVMREVILNNTSKCPFTYEIILPPDYRRDPDAPAVSTKGKDNKIKNPPMRCGNFLIMNDDNLLAPGTSRTLQIQFFATAARKFEETINFVISDTCPAEAQGVPLKLVGTGAMPTLDIWNIETTFREHLIVKDLSEYKVPESSPHCVFVENSVTLHFFCVTVNTSFTGTIDLYNNGLVACALTMKLHYQSNSNDEIFYLDKYETYIEPLLHKYLGIIFCPKALKEYRAVLEIKLKLLDNQEQSFNICLIGEGVIPRIHMISPPTKQHRMSLLQFPVTCLGSVSSKAIHFRNISTIKSIVFINIIQQSQESRPVFWLSTAVNTERMILSGNNDFLNSSMKITMQPEEIATINVHYNPLKKGRISCDVRLSIDDNPFEYFTVLCEAEAFLEDVILIGLEMLSMDVDLDDYKLCTEGTMSTVSTLDSRKKTRSAPIDKRKSKQIESRKSKRISIKQSDSARLDQSVLKYVLDFGGCEIFSMQRRSVIMANNSDKLYKFTWDEAEHVIIKPSTGYISPGEDKDLEVTFFSGQPVTLKKLCVNCSLVGISDDALTMDIKGSAWDSRQIISLFDHNRDTSLNERVETAIDEQVSSPEAYFGSLNIIIVYSAITEYTKYTCTLKDEYDLEDTFIYKTRKFEFNVDNVGNVPFKIVWSFQIDEVYPKRIDKNVDNKAIEEPSCGESINYSTNGINEASRVDPTCTDEQAQSKLTLFSGSEGRESVDTWFEVDLPFRIVPIKECLKPKESKTFLVTFSPLEAFDYKVRLKSCIDNLDPYDQNASCKISARSLIPYCHLDIEESDYLTSGRRKITGVALPSHMTVLEFNVLGSGCFKKTFNVINPTSEAYEFIFEMVISEKPELTPVHCDKLKGYVEGGTSSQVTFTFTPTAPGVYESQWKCIIPMHNLVMNLLVVGLVREPDVIFVPTILIIRNSLVGFTKTDVVMLKNNETESLKFEFKGNSLCNESGKTPVIVEPENGTLKALTETPIKVHYTPIQDGPLSFKIFCNIMHLTKYLTLCVNALSYEIKPRVTYYLIGNEHVLHSDAITNIHLDQTASTYERRIVFTIKNDGSATFFFDWHYATSAVKKYLQISVDPKKGHVVPANEVACTLYFTLKQVPVQAFPVTLSISDGPEYNICIHAEIEKPLYHFSCTEYDFGKCIVNAPDDTYKKNLAFINDDKMPLNLDLNFTNLPELYVDYHKSLHIESKSRFKIAIYFRPKQVKEYEFKLQFWVNSLCEEVITIKGEGVPLLFDLYEGCQKSFDLGPVKVGDKIIRSIEVMNHSKVPIDASFIFRDMYPTIEDTNGSEMTSVCLDPSTANLQAINAGPSRGQMMKNYKDDKIREQIAMDIQNALSSLKVVPNKCIIKPHRKVPLKIQFKPVGMISILNVQLNMKVFDFERPLVRLSGSATGMKLYFSQNSLQFGRVRKRGCKILKVMLLNKGDFGARFWWQPLKSDEFVISPQQGNIAARTNVSFTIAFRPRNHNPFIKVWASCNIENYMPLELALYGTCVDIGNVQNKTIYLECPVREIQTEYIIVTNPSDDMWLVLSEVSGGPFDTLKEFNVEPNSTFNIPVNFKPKTIGKHESQVLFSPLGESALFVNLIGAATHPNPNGTISFTIPSKEAHTEELLVYNITEVPETYVVSTELVKIVPDKFEGYYEIKFADTIKVWGEAAATCRWTYVCYEKCEMHLKVMFVNIESREYQYYDMTATVTPSHIVDTLVFISHARESIQKELVVTNPLSEEAEFHIRCVTLQCPEILKIGRNSEAALPMTYSPLVVGETEDILEINNYLIGSYIYKIVTKCLPAKEKSLEVTTDFGTSIPLRLRVQNKTDIKTEFLSRVSHPCIQADKEFVLGPFEKGKFLVWFEPTELGVQNCKVSFNSSVAGEFIFSIKGIATGPTPQGPFQIKIGAFTPIIFKNVFEDTRTFKIYVDREEFYVKTLYESIKSKKDFKISVFLSEKQQNISEMPTGCLTVETYDPAEPKIQWTYFLQGVP